MELGEKITRARKRENLTQFALSERIGVTGWHARLMTSRARIAFGGLIVYTNITQ